MIESEKNISIKNWAEDDRPREKLLLKGKSVLSDAELIAILIATGTREESAVDVAKKILASASNSLTELGKYSVKELKKIKGIGEAKAITIIAAIELGRRRKGEEALEKQQITTSRDAYSYFQPLLEDCKHEEFWIALLNRSSKIIGHKKISEGGITGTVVDTRVIFKYALEDLATSIILCHNHPSGAIKPSDADILLTQKIKAAGQIMNISVVDHIILGEKKYYSFADEDML
jgi:DNA repair protein RadC